MTQNFLEAALSSGNLSTTFTGNATLTLSGVTTTKTDTSASFDYIANTQKYTFSEGGSNAYYTLSDKTVTLTPATEGGSFTLEGELSSSFATDATFTVSGGVISVGDTKIAKVVGTNVYLTKDAFAASDSTIIIGGSGYSLATSTDTGYLGAVTSQQESLTSDGSTYTYRPSYSTEGVNIESSTATYKEATGSEATVTITGLADDLVVYKGKIYSNATNVFTVTDGVANLNAEAILPTELGSVDGTTVTLTDKAALKLTDGTATLNITNGTLKFDDAFGLLDDETTLPTDTEITLTQNGDGSYTYSGAHAPAYTTVDNGTYTYHAEATDGYPNFSISGLTLPTVEFTDGKLTGKDVENLFTVTKAADSNVYTVTLIGKAVPTLDKNGNVVGGASTISIPLYNLTNPLASTTTPEGFSFGNGTLTYKASGTTAGYTSDDGGKTWTLQAASGGETLFTLSGLTTLNLDGYTLSVNEGSIIATTDINELPEGVTFKDDSNEVTVDRITYTRTNTSDDDDNPTYSYTKSYELGTFTKKTVTTEETGESSTTYNVALNEDRLNLSSATGTVTITANGVNLSIRGLEVYNTGEENDEGSVTATRYITVEFDNTTHNLDDKTWTRNYAAGTATYGTADDAAYWSGSNNSCTYHAAYKGTPDFVIDGLESSAETNVITFDSEDDKKVLIPASFLTKGTITLENKGTNTYTLDVTNAENNRVYSDDAANSTGATFVKHIAKIGSTEADEEDDNDSGNEGETVTYFTYTSKYTPEYWLKSTDALGNPTIAHKAGTTAETFRLEGLGLKGESYTVTEGTNGTVNITNGQSGDALVTYLTITSEKTGEGDDAVTTKTVNLKAAALPSEVTDATKINFRWSHDGYNLALDGTDENIAKAFTVDSQGSVSGSTFTTATYKPYFTTNADGEIVGHAAVGGETFTIGNITLSGEVTTTVTSNQTTHAVESITTTVGNLFSVTTNLNADGDGIAKYTFNLNKVLLEQITAGENLTITKTAGTGTVESFDLSIANSVTAGTLSGDQVYTTAVSGDATFVKDNVAEGATQTYTYTAKVTNYDYYTVEDGKVTHVAQDGGQKFTLSGDFSDTVKNATSFVIKETTNSSGKITGHVIHANNESGTIIGNVYFSTSSNVGKPFGAVYLTADAFKESDSAITLKDADNKEDGISYYLTTNANAPYLGTYSATSVDTAATFENGTYTAATSKAGVTKSGDTTAPSTNEKGRTTTLTYNAGGASIGSSFTVSGLNNDLSTSDVLPYKEINDVKNWSFISGQISSGYYKITGNVTLNRYFVVGDGKNVVIDIAEGATLSLSDTVKSKDSNSNTRTFEVKSGGSLTIQGKGTLDATSNRTNNPISGIVLWPTTENKTANLTVNGDVTIKGDDFAITGNGSQHGTNITINGGTIKASTAIYHPQDGTLVINGGKIEGTNAGVEMRSGELYINGGIIKSNYTGDSGYHVTANGSGTTTYGAAVAIAQHSTNKDITVQITGGTIGDSNTQVALSVANPNGSSGATNTVQVNVTGGTFNGSTNSIVNDYDGKSVDISGGTFTGEAKGSSTINVAKDVELTKDTNSKGEFNTDATITDLPNKIAASETTTKKVYIGQNSDGKSVIVVTKADLAGNDISITSGDATLVLSGDVPQLVDGKPPVVLLVKEGLTGVDDGTDDKDGNATYTTKKYTEYYTAQNDGKSAKHFTASGEDITISGLGNIIAEEGKTLADYIKNGNITVTESGSVNADGQYVPSYEIKVKKEFFDKLSAAIGQTSALTFSTNNNAQFTLAFDGDTTTNYTEFATKIYTNGSDNNVGGGDPTAEVATVDGNTTSAFTYTAAKTKYEYFELSSGANTASSDAKTITFHAQEGGKSFTLSGFDSSWKDFTLSGDEIIASKTLAQLPEDVIFENDANEFKVGNITYTRSGDESSYTYTAKVTVAQVKDTTVTLMSYEALPATVTAGDNPTKITLVDTDSNGYTLAIDDEFSGLASTASVSVTNGSFTAPTYRAHFKVENNVATCDVASFGGEQFTLTGFADGLSVDFGALYDDGYAIKLDSKIVGYLKVTLNSDETAVKKYDFKFTDKSAISSNLDTTTNNKISVALADDDSTSTVGFSLDLEIPELLNGELSGGTWSVEVANAGKYKYEISGGANYVVKGEPNSSAGNKITSYTYTAPTDNLGSRTYYMWFYNLGNIENGTLTETLNKYITFQEEVSNGSVSRVIGTVTTEGTKYLDTSNDNYIYGSNTTIEYVTKLSDDYKNSLIENPSLTLNTDTYTFKAAGISAGFIETKDFDDYPILSYDSVGSGGDSFAIVGLRKDLKLYKVSDSSYAFYAESDVNLDSQGNVTSIKDGKTALVTVVDGTLTKTGNNEYLPVNVTILSKDALADNAATITLTDSDNGASKRMFNLALDDSLTDSLQSATEESFELVAEGGTSYVYTPGTYAAYYSAPTSSGRSNAKNNITWTATLNTARNVFPELNTFTIDGLSSGLEGCKIVANDGETSETPNGSKYNYPYLLVKETTSEGENPTTTQTVIARIGTDGVIELYKEAFTPEQAVKLISGTINVTSGNTTTQNQMTLSTMSEKTSDAYINQSSSSVTSFTGTIYQHEGRSEGYEKNTDGSIVFHEKTGLQTFNINGLYQAGGTFGVDASGNIIRTVNSSTATLATVDIDTEKQNELYPVTVTLQKDAFDTSATAADQTITLTDTSGDDYLYSLSFANDFSFTTAGTTITQNFTGNNGSYTFTNVGSDSYFSEGISSATYHAKTGGQSFSINGLSVGNSMTVSGNNVTGTVNNVSGSFSTIGTLVINNNKKTGVFTITNVDALGSISLGGSKAITLTDNIGALDGNADNQINFSLAFGDAFKTSAEQIDATFVKGDTAGQYTFSAAHSGAYVTGGTSSTDLTANTTTWNWIYNQEAQYDQVTITGLSRLIAESYNLNPAGTGFVNGTDTFLTFNDNTFTFTADALSSAVVEGASISIASGNEKYKLALDSKVNQQALTQMTGNDGKGTFEQSGNNYTFTAAKYQQYFTLGSDSRSIIGHAAAGGDSFTFSGLSINGTLNPDTTVNANGSISTAIGNLNVVTNIGTDSAITGYTFQLNKAFLEGNVNGCSFSIAGNKSFNMEIVDGGTSLADHTAGKVLTQVVSDSATFGKVNDAFTFTTAIGNYEYFTLDNGAGTLSTSDKTVTRHAQVGGISAFTLGGDGLSSTYFGDTSTATFTVDSNGVITSGGISIGKVGASSAGVAEVYLTAAAFSGTNAVITLQDINDSDDVTYKLAADNVDGDAFLNATTDQSNNYAVKEGTGNDSGKYTYTKGAQTEGVLVDETNNTLTYLAANNGSNLTTVSGLSSGKTVTALPYVEIKSASDLTVHFDANGNLKSGYYKFVKNENDANTITLNSQISVGVGCKVVIDVDKDVTLTNKASVTENDGSNFWHNGIICVRHGGDLTIQGEGTIKTTSTGDEVYSAVVLTKKGDDPDTAGNAKLTVNGSVTLEGYYYGISGNGSIDATNKRWSTDVTINGGTVKGTHGSGIYNPQHASVLTVNGGEILGEETGIEMASGDLIVKGGYIHSTAAPTSSTENNNGTKTAGAGIAIAPYQNSASGITRSLTFQMTGGTVEGYTALSVANPNNAATGYNVPTVKITGGTFICNDSLYSGDGEKATNAVVYADNRATLSIEGGVFYGKISNSGTVNNTSATGNNVNIVMGGDKSKAKFADNKDGIALQKTIAELGSGFSSATTSATIDQKTNASDPLAYIVVDETGKKVLVGDALLNSQSVTATESYNPELVGNVLTAPVVTNNSVSTTEYTINLGGYYNASASYIVAQDVTFTISGLELENNITVTDYINLDNISAKYENGGYTITLNRGFVEMLKEGSTVQFTNQNTSDTANINVMFATYGFSSTYDNDVHLLTSAVAGSDSSITNLGGGSFTYTAKVDTRDYYSVGGNSFKHVAKVGGEPFTLSGLSTSFSNFALDGNFVTADGISIARIDNVSGSIYLTAKAFGEGAITLTDVAGDSVAYHLAYDNVAGDSFLNKFATNYTNGTFSIAGDVGTFTSRSKAEGITITGNSAVHNAAIVSDVVNISGLSHLTGTYSVSYDAAGGVSITNASNSVIATIDSTSAIKLTADALPTNVTSVQTIGFSGTHTGYSLTLADGVAGTAFQYNETDKATFTQAGDSFTFTSPTYKEYYTASGNSIFVHPSVGSQSFALTINGNFSSFEEGKTFNVSASSTNGLFTIANVGTITGSATTNGNTSADSFAFDKVTLADTFIQRIGQGGSVALSEGTFANTAAGLSAIQGDITATTESASFSNGVYTAKIDEKDKFELVGTSAIKHTAQQGGQIFKLSGDGLSSTISLADFSVNGASVYLKASAFTEDGKVITLTDDKADDAQGQSIDYALVYGDGTSGLKEFGTAGNAIANTVEAVSGTTGTYTYTQGGSYAGIGIVTNGASTTATYHAQTGGNQFTIGGLTSGLNLTNFQAGGYINVSGSTVTLNSLSALGTVAQGQSRAITFDNVANDFGTNASNDIHYSLSFGADFKFGSASTIDASFTDDNNDGTYVYNAAHSDAYTTGSDSNFTYYAEALYDVVNISGLSAGQAVNLTDKNLVDINNKVFTLKEGILPTTDGTIQITNGSASGYTLGVSGVATQAYTADLSGSSTVTVTDGKYTRPAFLAYYTGSGGTSIASHSATAAKEIFTLNGLSSSLTFTYGNDKITTVKDGETNLGTISFAEDGNYTVSLSKAAFTFNTGAGSTTEITLDKGSYDKNVSFNISDVSALSATTTYDWNLLSGSAVYQSSTTSSIDIDSANNKYTFTNANPNVGLFNINGFSSGLTSLSGIATVSDSAVTLTESAFNGASVITLTDYDGGLNYHLVTTGLAQQGDSGVTFNDSFTGNGGGSYSFKASGNLDYYTLATYDKVTTITKTAASGGASFTLTGLSAIDGTWTIGANGSISTGSVTIGTLSGTTFTVNAAALAGQSFSLSGDGYTLALGSDVSQIGSDSTPSVNVNGAFSNAGNKLTYTATSYKDYYTLDTTTNKSASHFNASGGEVFNISVSGTDTAITLDILNNSVSGITNISQSSSLVNGQYTINGYTFTVGTAVLDAIKQGGSLTFTPASGNGYSGSPSFAYVAGLSSDYRITQDNGASAVITAGDDGYFTYTAKINHHDYFSNATVGKLEHVAQSGGEPFKIKGLNDTFTTNADGNIVNSAGSVLAYVSGSGVVSLTQYAFDTASESALTISLLDEVADGITYKLALSDDLQTAYAGGTISENFATVDSADKYLYTASGTSAGVSLTGDSIATFTPQSGGQTFTITGLIEGLDLTTFKTYASFIGDTVTLNSLSALGTVAQGESRAITFTDNDDTPGNTKVYSLSFGADFNYSASYSNSNKPMSGNLLTTASAQSTAYTYKADHALEYTYGGSGTYTYNAEAGGYSTFTITGLSAGLLGSDLSSKTFNTILSLNNGVVTLQAAAFNSDHSDIVLSGTGYSLSALTLGTSAAHFDKVDNTFEYKDLKTFAGYSSTDTTTYKYSAETGGESVFTLSGLSNNITNITISGTNLLSGDVVIGTLGTSSVTLNQNALSTGTVSLANVNDIQTNNYTLSLTGVDLAGTSVAAHWNIPTAASYMDSVANNNDYWNSIGNNSFSFVGAQSAATLFSLSGVNLGTISNITPTNDKVITLTKDQLNNNGVTFLTNTGYTLALDGVSAPTSDGKAGWYNVVGGSATYKADGMSAGWTVGAGSTSIGYSAAVAGESLFTINGLSSGATFDNNALSGTVITLNQSQLTTSDVTFSYNKDGYTLALSGVSAPTSDNKEGWGTISGNSATYNASGTTEGWTVGAGSTSIGYSAAVAGESLFTINGFSTSITQDQLKAVTVSGYTVNLTNDFLPTATNPTLTLSGESYVFGTPSGIRSFTNDNDATKTVAQFVGNGSYSYTSQYTAPYFLTAKTSISYKGGTTASTFNISGLADGLTVSTDGTQILSGTTAVGSISDGTVAINSSSALANFTADKTSAIQLTDGGSVYTKLTLDAAILGNSSTHEAGFTKNDSTFNYSGSYHDAYFAASGDLAYDFTASTENAAAKFSITNLSNSATEAALNGALSGTTLTLTKDLLPDSLASGTSIKLNKTQNADDYSLALGDDVLKSIKFGGSFSGVTYTEAGIYEGYTVNASGSIVYNSGDDYTARNSETTFTLSGLNSTYTELTLTDKNIFAGTTQIGTLDNKNVTLYTDALDTSKTVSLNNNTYTLSLNQHGEGASVGKQEPAGFCWTTVTNGSASYQAGATAAYWSGESNSFSYTAAVDATNYFTVSGLSSDADLTNVVSGNIVTLEREMLDLSKTIQLVNVDDSNYTLGISGVTATDTVPTANASFSATSGTGDNLTYTYTAAYNDEYFSAATVNNGNGFVYHASEESSAKTFTLSGLKSGVNLGTDVIVGSDSTVTVKESAVAGGNNIVLTGDTFTLALDDALLAKIPNNNGSFTTLGGDSAVYTTGTYHYYKENGTYVASGGGGSTLTIDGLNTDFLTNTGISTAADLKDYITVTETTAGTLTLNVTNKDVFANAENDGEVAVTFTVPEGYSIAVGNSITRPEALNAGWKQTGNNVYSYSLGSTGKSYTLSENGNTLKYNASDVKNDQLVLGGLTENPNGKITFDETAGTATINQALVGDVTVQSNAGGYHFVFADNDFNNMAFTAGEIADSININGGASNLWINGGASDDTITVLGTNISVLGGAGADVINAGGSNISVLGGLDDDTISVSGESVTVNGGAGNDFINFSESATGVLEFSAGNDTVNYSASYAISFTDTYSARGVGNDVVFISGGNSLLVLDGRYHTISLVSGDGFDTIEITTNYADMLTYNERQTSVTLNGNDVTSPKEEFTAKELPASVYAGTVTSITAANSMSTAVYIHGNQNSNVITSNDNNNTIDGGAGNDKIYAGGGSETFVYEYGGGNDVIYGFDGEHDKISLVGASVAGYSTAITGDDIKFTFADDGTLTFKNIFATDTETTISIGGDASSTYTYKSSGAIVNNNRVTLTTNASVYAAAAGETITNYSDNVSLTGYGFKDIVNSSFSNGSITLGLGTGSIVLNGSKSGAIVLGKKKVSVGNDYFYDGDKFTLTTGNTGFSAPTGSTSAVIDASYVTGEIAITGTSGNDTLIGNTVKTTFTGGNGADEFIYNGGSAVITDYESIDSIFLKEEFDSAKVAFGSNSSIIIQGLLTINGAEGKDISINNDSYFFSTLGTFNDARTEVVLNSTITSYNFSAGSYSVIETIDASNVKGNLDVSLSGRAETFIYSEGDVTLNSFSNTGENIDTLNLPNGLQALSGVTVTGNKIELSFDNDKSLVLNVSDSSSAVAVGDDAYIFENNKVFTNDYRGVTLVGSETFDISKDERYLGVATVVANSGGAIAAGSFGLTMGGKNVSLKGGTGADTFIYTGGTVTISGYNSTNDKVSLTSNYSVSGLPAVSGSDVELTIVDANKGTGKIIFEGGKNSVPSVKVNGTTLYVPATGSPTVEGSNFNNSQASLATAVTVTGNTGDYSKVENSKETYAALTSITASQEDSKLAGNSKANTFIIAGGKENILTGGLGKDTFVFNSGGGIITDFGAGSTKNGQGTAFKTSASVSGYDPNTPTSYAESNDVVKVKGSVVEVAFNGYGNSKSTANSVFSAYVTYDPDGSADTDHNSGNEQTILLGNIVKPYYKKNAWKTDEVIAKTLKLWDTSTGTSKVLASSALATLFANTSSSDYADNIEKLDNIVTDKATTDDLAIIGLSKNSSLAASTDTLAANGLKKKTT